MEMMDVLAASREGKPDELNWWRGGCAKSFLPALLNQVMSYNYPGPLNQKWPSKEDQPVNLKKVIQLMADQVQGQPLEISW